MNLNALEPKQTASKKTEQKILFPPYGYINDQYQWDVDSRRVPDGFTVDGVQATPKQWQDFVEEIVTELASFLWPRYRQKTNAWEGAARAHAHALTIADLDLMSTLHPILNEQVLSDGKGLPRTHRAMFTDEDVGWPGSTPVPTLDHYIANASPELLGQVKDAVRKRLGGLGPAQLRFKQEMQRPRPYQTSFLLSREFRHDLAKSSLTPAMISGHCFQSMVTRTGAFMSLRLDIELVVGAVAGIQQYMVDVGDRRVFAGVHYPSDNISSWYCALRMCDHMFGEAGQFAKDFMNGAIQKSRVYQSLVTAIKGNPASPYAIPMRRLSEEVKRPATRTDIIAL